MSTHNALVVGAQGIIGRNVAEYLSTRPGWNVIGASRRTAQGVAVAVQRMGSTLGLEKTATKPDTENQK
jgi:NAD(P)-dependent dehydrogenase (short-subunit alcohol dehydrogenase family)